MLAVVALNGCYFVDETWQGARRLEPQAWSEQKVFFRGFRLGRVTSVATAVAVGGGGVATATAQGTTYGTQVELEVLGAAREALPFRAISPTMTVGTTPDYVIEGSLDFEWSTPWWTWLQWLDLGVHILFVPTFGSELEMSFELALYDRDFQLLEQWKGTRTVTHVGHVLQGVRAVGSSGYHELSLEYLRDSLALVGKDLVERMTTPGGQ